MVSHRVSSKALDRFYERFPCSFEGTIGALNKSWQYHVAIVELSEGGARISNGNYDIANESFFLSFRGGVTVMALAHTVWQDDVVVGVKFVAMMPYMRERLRATIEELKYPVDSAEHHDG